MSFGPLSQSEIWRPRSEIWPECAKSGVLPKSGICVFLFDRKDLGSSIQISEGCLRNLTRNLDFISKVSCLRQIADFGKGTPKGVGGLPPSGGEVHHPPLGKFHGPETGSDPDPTTAAGTAKHQPPSSSTRAANQKRRPPMADRTLSSAAAGATPKTPVPPDAARTI